MVFPKGRECANPSLKKTSPEGCLKMQILQPTTLNYLQVFEELYLVENSTSFCMSSFLRNNYDKIPVYLPWVFAKYFCLTARVQISPFSCVNPALSFTAELTLTCHLNRFWYFYCRTRPLPSQSTSLFIFDYVRVPWLLQSRKKTCSYFSNMFFVQEYIFNI